MIVSHMNGGLGNQMFQYSVARSISLSRREPLELDSSSYQKHKMHQGFELFDVFDLPAKLAQKESVNSLLSWRSNRVVRKILKRPVASRFRGKHFIIEPHFHYWGGIHNVPSNCYLEGYWQSENYFMDFEKEIRKDFEFKKLPLGQNSLVSEQIQAVNSVSLHVRRGDYISNIKASAMHSVCSLAYYQSAIEYVVEKLEQPTFFIFSDDIEWVKNNLRIDFPCHYIGHNQGKESYNDMRLMSLCRHNIIANSSFSWWGAWLNANQDKIVVAPEKWFEKSTNIQNLIPNGWTSI